MFQWIGANIGAIGICALLIAIVTAIIINLIKNKRRGKNSCSCGCGCSGCAMKDTCHTGIEETKK